MNKRNNTLASVITVILYVLLIVGLLGGVCMLLSNLISDDFIDSIFGGGSDDPDDVTGNPTYTITYTNQSTSDFTYTFIYDADCPETSYPGLTVEFGYTITDGGIYSSAVAVRTDTDEELVSLTTMAHPLTSEEVNGVTINTYTYDSSFIMPESNVIVTVYVDPVSSSSGGSSGDGSSSGSGGDSGSSSGGSSGGGSESSGSGSSSDEDACAHEYIGNDYIYIAEPTYTTAGSVYWQCTMCESKYYYTLVALQYVNAWAWSLEDYSATCTEDGEGLYTMSVTLYPYEDDRTLCADFCVVTSTPALGHIMGDPVVTVIPTFDTVGTAVSTCSRCGYDISYELPVLSNSSYSVSGNTATCTADGTATYSIVVNGYLISFTGVTEALGHKYSSYTVSVIPTSTSTGTCYRTCSRCGDTETKTLPILTDSRYTITNNTATAYAEGTGIYSISINGEYVSFTAETPRRSVDGVNPITITDYMYSTDTPITYETYTASSDNNTVVGDGETVVLYFYASDGYYFGNLEVDGTDCDSDFSITNSDMTLCVTLSNVYCEVNLGIVMCCNHTVTITGADHLGVTMEIGDDSTEVYHSTTAAVTTSLNNEGLTFILEGSDYYDEHPYTVTVTYVMRDGSGSYSKTVSSSYSRNNSGDYTDALGVWDYGIRDESYYVTSGNTSSLVHCYVGYLVLYFEAGDFDIQISVTTKTAEELYYLAEDGVITIG